ncbi:MAG: TonB-dependent receptor [Opitutus sp.]|nr:TonB-dependent receptor [Opitutus sp.]
MPILAADTEGFGGPTGYTLPEQFQNPFDDLVLVRNRFVDNPRKYYSENDSFRGLFGIRGEINELFSFEAAANLNKVNQMFRNENVIDRVALANAIDSNLINLFAREQDPAKMKTANIFGTAYSKNVSTLIGFDARLIGEIPDVLPAGSIRFAVGGETRRETLSAKPDVGSYTISDPNSPLYGSPSAWDGATTSDPFSVDRSVDSFFAEVRVPITSAKQAIKGFHTMELDLAARKDFYSDTDDPLVPKISLRWLPVNDEFAIRASYSESFSAASLYSLFGPGGVGFTEQPVGVEFVDGRVMDENVDQGFLRILSNPNLLPEEAQNYSAGIVYSPKAIKGLSVELNYFYIKQDQIVGAINDLTILQDVETNGADSEYADRVRIGSFNGTAITAPGQLSAAFDAAGGSFTRVFVTNYSENFVSGRQDGFDATVNYAFDVPSVARFNIALNGLFYNRFSVDDEDYVGTTNGSSVLNGGTIPDWRGNLRIEATRGNFDAGIVIDYIPSVTDTVASETQTDPTMDRHVESFTSVDLYLGYTFKGGEGLARYVDGLSLRVGALNVFNEHIPLAAASWTDANADTATYGALGREFFISASYKF